MLRGQEKKEIAARRGDDTSAEKSVQSDKDYSRGMCKNRAGANQAAVNQERFHRGAGFAP